MEISGIPDYPTGQTAGMSHHRLFTFHGGIKLDANKAPSTSAPIQPAPLSALLRVPLRQNSRATARAIVQPGARVLKGQRIGIADVPQGTAVHAPTSGTVREIVDYPVAHPVGLSGPCVVIESDGEERWIEHAPFASRDDDKLISDRSQTAAYLRDAGIVGLGGAVFPSHLKLGDGETIHTLILNGAECEPWITCDDLLMREYADEIVAGAEILSRLCGARQVLVGIEDNKPEAIAAMRHAARQSSANIQVVAVPSIYPTGSGKHLIRVLTGIELPSGFFGPEYGVQCFNVGTAHAVYRAIEHGEPLISRIVTFTGNVAQAGNYSVPIGTPVETLFPLVQPREDTDRFLVGGPMMGFPLSHTSAPIDKASNCIIAASPALFPPIPPEQPCIRCGTCVTVCPADLQPFALYWHTRSRHYDKVRDYHLFDCIECGCCDFVCPSNIPLASYFRFAKSEVLSQEKENKIADSARERFERRTARLEREKAEKAAKMAAKVAETRKKAEQQISPASGDATDAADTKKALVAAALARAKAQQQNNAVSAEKKTENSAAAADITDTTK